MAATIPEPLAKDQFRNGGRRPPSLSSSCQGRDGSSRKASCDSPSSSSAPTTPASVQIAFACPSMTKNNGPRSSAPTTSQLKEYFPGIAENDRVFGEPLQRIHSYTATTTTSSDNNHRSPRPSISDQSVYSVGPPDSSQRSIFAKLQPLSRMTSKASLQSSVATDEIEVIGPPGECRLPKAPPIQVVSQWSQREFLTVDPYASKQAMKPASEKGTGANSPAPSRSVQLFKSLIGGGKSKEQEQGTVKIVLKRSTGGNEAEEVEVVEEMVCTTITRSSGPDSAAIVPYGRGGAARAAGARRIEEHVFGDDESVGSSSNGSSRSAFQSSGKAFVQGVVRASKTKKKERGSQDDTLHPGRIGESQLHRHHSRSSTDSLASASSGGAKSTSSKVQQQHQPAAIVFGRGGAARAIPSKNARMQMIQEEKEAVLAAMQALKVSNAEAAAPSPQIYGRGGFARTAKAKVK